MPKLAIYVPKSDMKLIDRWRKRLNFSQIFMRALRSEVESKRSKKTTPQASETERVNAAVSFYKSQMREAGLATESLHELGVRTGREQILDCATSVEVIPQLVALESKDELTDEDLVFIKRQIEKTSAAADERLIYKGSKKKQREAAVSFAKGYIHGIMTTWQEIAGQL